MVYKYQRVVHNVTLDNATKVIKDFANTEYS